MLMYFKLSFLEEIKYIYLSSFRMSSSEPCNGKHMVTCLFFLLTQVLLAYFEDIPINDHKYESVSTVANKLNRSY